MIEVSDNWADKYYDPFLATTTLDTSDLRKLAIKEVALLKKVLQFQKGQTLLDIPCGTGRHSIRLARMGLNVTGLDISKACLAECRKKLPESLWKRLSFEQADMRDLHKYRGQYDFVINMFTSLGYFSTARENQKALRQMVSSIKPGGRFFMGIMNREWLLKVFRPIDWMEHDDYFLLSKREYNPRTRYLVNELVYVIKKGRDMRRYQHKIRLYDKSELVTMMRQAGIYRIKAFGDLEGGPFYRTRSNRIFLTGEKR